MKNKQIEFFACNKNCIATQTNHHINDMNTETTFRYEDFYCYR